MRFAALLCALFFSCAGFAHAEAAVKKEVCTFTTKTDKSEPLFDEDGGQSALTKLTGSSNLCTDERVTLSGVLGNELVNEITCLCRTPEKLKEYGCESGQRQPLVTLSINKKITGCVSDEIVISKCAADPERAYEEACKKGTDMKYVSESDPRSITIAPAGVARPMPSLGIWYGSDMLTKMLVSSGVPEEQATELATQNRQSSIDYIRALASKDTAAVQAKADVLGITPNFSPDQQSALMAITREKIETKADGSTGNQYYRPEVTGLSVETTRTGGEERSPARMQCGVDSHIGNIMYTESGCGRNTVNPNSNVQGPYQFLCSTWNSYTQSTGNGQYSCSCTAGGYYAGPCAAVNDAGISTQVMKARDAGFQSVYGSRCAEAGLNWSTCSYTIHFAGESGFQRLLNAYQTNPNMPMTQGNVDRLIVSGAYGANRGVFGQTQTVSDYFRWADNKMNGQSTIIASSVSTGQSYSPFGGFTSASGAQTIAYNSESPFGQTNPFASITGQFGNSGFGQQRSPYGQTQNPYQYQQQPLQQPLQPPFQPPVVQPIVQPPLPIPVLPVPTPIPVTSPTSTPTTTPATTPTTPVLSLKIQPKDVTVGTPFIVSWTSVGMGSGTPCVLTQTGKEIARGASGARQITVPFATTTTFLLTCTDGAGIKHEKSDNAIVK